jgi:anti-sigma factor RsiW
MSCLIQSEKQEMLVAYSSGRLDDSQVDACERHLEGCGECRQFVAAQKSVWSALDAWEPPPVSPAFDARLYQRIERETTWWERVRRNLGVPGLRPALPLAAAACITLAIGVAISYHPAAEPGARKAQVESLKPEQIEHVLDDMQILRDFDRAVSNDAGSSEL